MRPLAIRNSVIVHESDSPRLELVAELGDARLRTLEGADAAELHDRGNVARGIEERFLHAIPQRRVPGGDIAETQAGHRVRLAERVERNGPVVHAGERRGADMLPLVEHDVLIGLFGDEPDAVPLGAGAHGFYIRTRPQ